MTDCCRHATELCALELYIDLGKGVLFFLIGQLSEQPVRWHGDQSVVGMCFDLIFLRCA